MKTQNTTSKTNAKVVVSTNVNVNKFETIQEWLSSKPSVEEVAKVLTMVNRKSIHEMRVQYYDLQKDIKKLSKLQENLKIAGFEENKNISEKTAILEAKLKTIVDTIGEPKKKVQKEAKPNTKSEPIPFISEEVK